MTTAGQIFRGYCVTCAFLVTSALVAAGVAQATGLVRWEELPAPRAIADMLTGSKGAASAEVISPDLPAPGPGAAETDSRLWEVRLRSLGENLRTDASDLGAQQRWLDQREENLEVVGNALAELASWVVRKPVTGDELARAPEPWLERIQEIHDQRMRAPRLLETLEKMEPEALATILAGRERDPDLSDEIVVRLLAELPPRRAGEVLTEMGEIDPAAAGRLIRRMGGGDSEVATRDRSGGN